MANYAVYHAQKHSSSAGGLGNHIDRVKGMEHTYQHSDPERLHLNRYFKVDQGREKMPLAKAVKNRIEEGYKGKRKLRANSVKYVSHILTGSHEKMNEIFSNQESAKGWLNANYAFLADEYGKENIVRFTLHLDEKTPHLHAVTVPLTNDGRLSAKEIMGNKKDFQDRQDRYAEMMKPFGLERGIRSTGRKRETVQDYYNRLNQDPISEIEPVKGLLGVNKDKTIEKLKDALKTSNTHLKEAKKTIQRTEPVLKKIGEIKKERDEVYDAFNKLAKSRDNAIKLLERALLPKSEMDIEKNEMIKRKILMEDISLKTEKKENKYGRNIDNGFGY